MTGVDASHLKDTKSGLSSPELDKNAQSTFQKLKGKDPHLAVQFARMLPLFDVLKEHHAGLNFVLTLHCHRLTPLFCEAPEFNLTVLFSLLGTMCGYSGAHAVP